MFSHHSTKSRFSGKYWPTLHSSLYVWWSNSITFSRKIWFGKIVIKLNYQRQKIELRNAVCFDKHKKRKKTPQNWLRKVERIVRKSQRYMYNKEQKVTGIASSVLTYVDAEFFVIRLFLFVHLKGVHGLLQRVLTLGNHGLNALIHGLCSGEFKWEHDLSATQNLQPRNRTQNC